MDNYVIFGVHLDNRAEEAVQVQKLLTEYGCNIKTRVGLHDVDEKSCSKNGLILLELIGDSAKVEELQSKLEGVKGIVVKKMVF